MASTSVKVAIRVRPLTAKELLDDARECIHCSSDSSTISIGVDRPTFSGQGLDMKQFTFDHVFDPNVSQDFVYSQCAHNLVQTFLNGFNATIFAYGQTGSGKTFTMGAGLDNLYDVENQGIIPRSIHDIFNKLHRKSQENPQGFKYTLSVTFIELYNEDLADLLNPRPKTAGSGSWGGLTIREDANGNIVWTGIREETIESPEELLTLLQKGTLCRTTGSTDMNASSSRSHAIFSLILKQQKWISSTLNASQSDETKSSSGENVDMQIDSVIETAASSAVLDPTNTPDGSWQKIVSKFHFVDLAGSERLKKTNAEGDRKREGININKGLLVLGNVIHALSEESKQVNSSNGSMNSFSGHVPYRESKLTRLLQDSLGGNSQTLMLACVSPSTTNYAESLNTLQYANRAKNIKNKVSVNQEWSSVANENELRYLRSLVTKLQTEVSMLRSKSNNDGMLTSSSISYGLNSFHSKHNLSNSQYEMSTIASQQYERHLQQAQVNQSNLQEELKMTIEDLEKTKFDKCRYVFKYQQLTDRLSNALEELELTKSNQSSTQDLSFNNKGKSTSQDSLENYLQQIVELRKKLVDSEDQLLWYHEAIEKISKRQKIQNLMENATVSTKKDELDVAFEERVTLNDQVEALSNTLLNSSTHDALVYKIQKDILENERQISLLSKRDAEYDVMKTAYEKKLKNLQDQLQQVTKERDLAVNKISKISSSESSLKEKVGALAIKTKFEKENKRLELELNDLRKKLVARANAKFKQEQATKSLRNQISTLRVEKQLLEKKLKEEAERNREILNAKVREFEKYKKKQDRSFEIGRRPLRQEGNSQRNMSKSDFNSAEQSLDNERKNVFASLSSVVRDATSQSGIGNVGGMRKSNSAYKISELENSVHSSFSKSGRPSGSRGDSRRARTRSLSPDSMTALFGHSGSDDSEDRRENRAIDEAVSTSHSPKNESSQSDVSKPYTFGVHQESDKAIQGYKHAIEKELWLCQNAKRIEIAVKDLEMSKEKLLVEQNELISEREKCLQIDAEELGYSDASKPQYMDDRLNVILSEIKVIDMRLSELVAQTLQISATPTTGWNKEATGSSNTNETKQINIKDGQLAWENALMILSSCSPTKMNGLAQLYLDEVIALGVYREDLLNKISEKDKMVLELRAALDLMRNAAMESAIDYDRRLTESQTRIRAMNSLIKDCYDGVRTLPDSMESFNQEINEYMLS